MSQSGANNFGLTKLSSAASSNLSSREASLDNNKNQQGRNNNRRRRRSLTPHKSKRTNKFKKQKSPSSSRSRSYRSNSKGSNRSRSVQSNKSYYKQTSKKQAWKSQICKYWKKGKCKYGDECEWQHYDFTQIDFCETKKKERYNQTKLNDGYLVQITTTQYMREEEIMELIGNPKHMKQAIALAIKNKKQSKLMKKDIMKELRKGTLNEIQKIQMKRDIIKKYIPHMQIDKSNEISKKRMEKRQIRIQQAKEIAKKKADVMEAENNENHIQQPESQYIEPYKQQQDRYYDVTGMQQQHQTQQQYLIKQQNTQQQNNTQPMQDESNNNSTSLKESNLYFDQVNQEKLMINQQQQQITQNQPPSIIDNFEKNQKLNPGLYTIKKNLPQQQSILNFLPIKTDQDQLPGTGKTTQIMEDDELRKYYQIDNIKELNENKLIQYMETNRWTEDIIKGLQNISPINRDKAEETWDEKGFLIMRINTFLFNDMINAQTQSKDPQESPTYKVKQAVISAMLRYMEKQSDIRLEVSSQRAQIFILNKIKNKEQVIKDTIWMTGMDKRAKETITKNNSNPLCILLKFA